MKTMITILAVGLLGCYGQVKRFGDDTTTADGTGDPDTWSDSIGPDASDTVDPDVPDVPWDTSTPPGACPTGWECRTAETPSFGGVDILVVVDNSMSMAEEQETMARQFPILIQKLLDPAIDPETGRPVHIPVTDVHIGVVSTDMGTGGYTVETCSDPVDGDDGVLQHTPSTFLPDCDTTYPAFLGYDVESPDPAEVEALAGAFGCIATLGTGGCGFEQQLEAARRALVDHASGSGPNAGFLRDDSVVMIMFLTDEEDCSVLDPLIFDTSAAELGHMNLRCFSYPDMVHEVSRYVDGFRSIREGSHWPVLLGMLVGVPPDEKECNGYGDQIGECLDVDLMQQRIDPTNPTALAPSCDSDFGRAYPPRRFVRIAQEFGRSAYVHSICQDDYEPAMNALSLEINALADLTCEGSIIDLDKHPSDSCLCLSDCRVIHVLPDLSPCPPLLTEWDHDGDTVPNRVLDGGGSQVTACEVPAAHTRVMSCDRGCHDPYQAYMPDGEGWFYSLSYTGVACPTVSFTPGHEAPGGASTFVACP